MHQQLTEREREREREREKEAERNMSANSKDSFWTSICHNLSEHINVSLCLCVSVHVCMCVISALFELRCPSIFLENRSVKICRGRSVCVCVFVWVGCLLLCPRALLKHPSVRICRGISVCLCVSVCTHRYAPTDFDRAMRWEIPWTPWILDTWPHRRHLSHTYTQTHRHTDMPRQVMAHRCFKRILGRTHTHPMTRMHSQIWPDRFWQIDAPRESLDILDLGHLSSPWTHHPNTHIHTHTQTHNHTNMHRQMLTDRVGVQVCSSKDSFEKSIWHNLSEHICVSACLCASVHVCIKWQTYESSGTCAEFSRKKMRNQSIIHRNMSTAPSGFLWTTSKSNNLWLFVTCYLFCNFLCGGKENKWSVRACETSAKFKCRFRQFPKLKSSWGLPTLLQIPLCCLPRGPQRGIGIYEQRNLHNSNHIQTRKSTEEPSGTPR